MGIQIFCNHLLPINGLNVHATSAPMLSSAAMACRACSLSDDPAITSRAARNLSFSRLRLAISIATHSRMLTRSPAVSPQRSKSSSLSIMSRGGLCMVIPRQRLSHTGFRKHRCLCHRICPFERGGDCEGHRGLSFKTRSNSARLIRIDRKRVDRSSRSEISKTCGFIFVQRSANDRSAGFVRLP
jgi:hypothetical protein